MAQLVIDQDKARLLGLDSQTLATGLQALLSGANITEYREQDKTVSIAFRIADQDRNGLSRLQDLNIPIGNGKYIPLDQIATIRYEAEDGLIWRRDLQPTIATREIPQWRLLFITCRRQKRRFIVCSQGNVGDASRILLPSFSQMCYTQGIMVGVRV